MLERLKSYLFTTRDSLVVRINLIPEPDKEIRQCQAEVRMYQGSVHST